MSNDTREALAAKCKELADTLYTGPIAHKAACVRLVHEAIDRLAALTEQPAAQRADAALPPYYIAGPYADDRYAICETATGRVARYLSPQQLDAIAAPQEEIRQCYDVAHGRGPNFVGKLSPFSIAVARAIEAAHGIGAAPAAPAQEPQQPDVPVKQAAVLMKLIRAAWKGDPGIAEAYGNLLAERMDADGLTGRYVRDMLAALRGERQEVLIHPAAASSPAPAVLPTSEAVAELVKALERVLLETVWLSDDYLETFRDWPLDATIQGWDKARWLRAAAVVKTARALIAKHGQQGGSNA